MSTIGNLKTDMTEPASTKVCAELSSQKNILMDEIFKLITTNCCKLTYFNEILTLSRKITIIPSSKINILSESHIEKINLSIEEKKYLKRILKEDPCYAEMTLLEILFLRISNNLESFSKIKTSIHAFRTSIFNEYKDKLNDYYFRLNYLYLTLPFIKETITDPEKVAIAAQTALNYPKVHLDLDQFFKDLETIKLSIQQNKITDEKHDIFKDFQILSKLISNRDSMNQAIQIECQNYQECSTSIENPSQLLPYFKFVRNVLSATKSADNQNFFSYISKLEILIKDLENPKKDSKDLYKEILTNFSIVRANTAPDRYMLLPVIAEMLQKDNLQNIVGYFFTHNYHTILSGLFDKTFLLFLKNKTYRHHHLFSRIQFVTEYIHFSKLKTFNNFETVTLKKCGEVFENLSSIRLCSLDPVNFETFVTCHHKLYDGNFDYKVYKLAMETLFDPLFNSELSKYLNDSAISSLEDSASQEQGKTKNYRSTFRLTYWIYFIEKYLFPAFEAKNIDKIITSNLEKITPILKELPLESFDADLKNNLKNILFYNLEHLLLEYLTLADINELLFNKITDLDDLFPKEIVSLLNLEFLDAIILEKQQILTKLEEEKKSLLLATPDPETTSTSQIKESIKTTQKKTPRSLATSSSAKASSANSDDLHLKNVNGSKVIKILKEFGFRLLRQNGSSHAILTLNDDAQVVVPVTSKDLPKGTLHSISSQAKAALDAKKES